ncbi:MAG: TetR family transcriptional regulator [Limnothrix sp. RL_2_0]|nr:TetR family transcriptional regulator [Limnothrix sp. RL_2_0]
MTKLSVEEKQSDRRSQVALAAMKLIAEQGLQKTSLRAIAHELGCTTGVLTHYFRNKDELLLFLLEVVMERLAEKMAITVQDVEGIDRLTVMMLAVFPTTDELKQIWRVWLAFVGYMPGHVGLMEEHKTLYQEFKTSLKNELTALVETGAIATDLDLDFEAAAWIALMDGIGVNMLAAPQTYSDKQLKMMINRHVRSLLPNIE